MAAPFQNYSDGTFLTDLVKRPEFLTYLSEEIVERSAFVQSGVLTRNAALDCRAGGTRVRVPYFQPINPTEEIIQSNATWGESTEGYLTPKAITASEQVMTILHRGFAYAVDDLSKLGTGADPMAAIRGYLAASINKLRTATLIAQLTGIFGDALANNSLDITGDAEKDISAMAVIAAKAKLGERGESLSAIALHPNQYYYLQQIGMLTFTGGNVQSGDPITWGAGGTNVTSAGVANFAGLRVIVDSQLPHSGGVYTSYLFGPGAVSEGVQQELRIESERNILSKQDVMAVDYHYGMHVNGVTWNDAADNPTNSDMEDDTNWTLKYNADLIPVVQLKSGTPLDPIPAP
jgi:hypothetical protein